MTLAIHISNGALRQLKGEVGGMSVGDEGRPACDSDARGPVTRGEPPTCPACAEILHLASLL